MKIVMNSVVMSDNSAYVPHLVFNFITNLYRINFFYFINFVFNLARNDA